MSLLLSNTSGCCGGSWRIWGSIKKNDESGGGVWLLLLECTISCSLTALSSVEGWSIMLSTSMLTSVRSFLLSTDDVHRSNDCNGCWLEFLVLECTTVTWNGSNELEEFWLLLITIGSLFVDLSSSSISEWLSDIFSPASELRWIVPILLSLAVVDITYSRRT